MLVNTWLVHTAVFPQISHYSIRLSLYLNPLPLLIPFTDLHSFLLTASRENREHLATSHLLPPRAKTLGKISEVSWEAWLSLSLLCHCPAWCFWNVTAGRPQHLGKHCQLPFHPNRLTHKHFACRPHFYQQNWISLCICKIIFQKG